MGTRSFVGRRIDEDRVEVVYGQLDGDIKSLGLVLHQSYHTPEKLEKVLELGAFRFLGNSTDYPGDKYYDTTPDLKKWSIGITSVGLK